MSPRDYVTEAPISAAPGFVTPAVRTTATTNDPAAADAGEAIPIERCAEGRLGRPLCRHPSRGCRRTASVAAMLEKRQDQREPDAEEEINPAFNAAFTSRQMTIGWRLKPQVFLRRIGA